MCIKDFNLSNKWYNREFLFPAKKRIQKTTTSYYVAIKFVDVLFWQIYTVTPLVQRTGPLSEMEVLAHEAIGPHQYLYGDERK